MVFGSIADVFFQWEYLGVFDFVLPFLLVFAIVFGTLTATNMLGKNRGVAVIIAFVIGLMSLRYQNYFSAFLSELFPRLGIGISILLALLILVGLFIADEQRRYWFYGLGALGAVIAIIIVYQTLDRQGFIGSGGVTSDAVGFIILAVLLVGVIIAVASGGGRHETGTGVGTIALNPWRGDGGRPHP